MEFAPLMLSVPFGTITQPVDEVVQNAKARPDALAAAGRLQVILIALVTTTIPFIDAVIVCGPDVNVLTTACSAGVEDPVMFRHEPL